jgi:uncharacterized protein (TIGR03435 family)
MRSVLLLSALAVAHAQSPTFEVVSIKLSPPDATFAVGGHGGPGTKYPGVFSCENLSLRNIVWNGFHLQMQEQLVTPAWMNEPRFDIKAKVPEGATRDQFYQMFQHMLVERFGLKFHRDQKEVQGYNLVVGKTGPKFKECGPEPPKDGAAPDSPQPRPGMPLSRGPDGFPVPFPGRSGVYTSGSRARGQWLRASIERLATDLSSSIGKPVINATGLNGKYDLYLYWVADNPMRPDTGGPAIFAALQDQLGLKLEARKVTVPVVVVDHAERVPTEN